MTTTPSIFPVSASEDEASGGDDTSLGGCRFPPPLAAGGVGPGTEMSSKPLPSNSFVCVPMIRGGSLEVDRLGGFRTGGDGRPMSVFLRGGYRYWPPVTM